MGSTVAQTLANVMPSYFKIFILLPSDKNVLWSRAYHLQFGTWWGAGEGAMEFIPASRGQVMQNRRAGAAVGAAAVGAAAVGAAAVGAATAAAGTCRGRWA